jgi:hypothetical protein
MGGTTLKMVITTMKMDRMAESIINPLMPNDL